LEYVLWVVGERGYFPGVLPKFHMMAANQLLCSPYGYFVIGAFKRN
jgi:hypothetical protein